MNYFFFTVKRELLLLKKNPMRVFIPWLFFFLVGFLFPLAITSDHTLLQTMGAGIIWIAILLAQLLSLSCLFQQDYDMGVLDQLLMKRHVFTEIIAAKIVSQWLFIVLPMIVLSVLVSQLYFISWSVLKIL